MRQNRTNKAMAQSSNSNKGAAKFWTSDKNIPIGFYTWYVDGKVRNNMSKVSLAMDSEPECESPFHGGMDSSKTHTYKIVVDPKGNPRPYTLYEGKFNVKAGHCTIVEMSHKTANYYSH